MTILKKFDWKTGRDFSMSAGAMCMTVLLVCSVWLVPATSAAESKLTGTLYGQTSGGNRYPIPFASIQFCEKTGDCVDTFTGADGSYSIDVDHESDYNVIAPSRDGGFLSDDIFIRRGMKNLDILAD